MRRNFILIVLVLISTCYTAQGWKRKYYLPNTSSSVTRDAIETPNGNFIMVGNTSDTIMGKLYNRLTLVGTDASGNFLWRKSYGDTGFWYVNSILTRRGPVLTYANFFYHTSIVLDSQGRYYTSLLKFNYSGDTLWQKFLYSTTYSYTPGVNFYAAGLAKSLDGGALITGTCEDFNLHQTSTVVLKTDINGNELWRRTISKSAPHMITGYALIQDKSSKRIIVTGHQYLDTGTYGSVLILDSLGNELTRTKLIDEECTFTDLIQLKDGTFMTCGAIDMHSDVGGFPRDKGIILNFDINGYQIWSKTYDTLSRFAGIYYLHERKSGDIMLGSYIDTAFFIHKNTLGAIKMRLHCIDREGRVKWKRFVGFAALLPPDTNASTGYNFGFNKKHSEYMHSMNPTKDGGYVIAGWAIHANNNGGSIPYTIVKIDSLGCDTTTEYCRANTHYTSVEELTHKETQFNIYPNPTKNELTLEWLPEAILNNKPITIKLNDLNGRTLKMQTAQNNKTTLYLEDIAMGMYFVQVYQEGVLLGTQKVVKE